MLTLGIESSCDETAIAVVKNNNEILSNKIASQTELHARYGGVIPELASRQHLEAFPQVLKEALKEAKVTLNDIDLIAVAQGPGLIGALMVGVNFAKGLAFGLDKPLIGVSHIEAHLYSAIMEHQDKVTFPALGLVVSGGHTALFKVQKLGHYELIGQTRDDALGEAFDKVASLLKLPYPGGPEIEKLAKQGDSTRYPFKVGQIKNRPFDFSFSGLKTAVLYTVKGQNASKHSPLIIKEADKKDVAASFQRAAFTDIVDKTLLAAQKIGAKSLLIGGGVSQSQTLRALFTRAELPLFWPPKGLSLDNAAMIAGLGAYQYRLKKENHLQTVHPSPRLSLVI